MISLPDGKCIIHMNLVKFLEWYMASGFRNYTNNGHIHFIIVETFSFVSFPLILKYY